MESKKNTCIFVDSELFAFEMDGDFYLRMLDNSGLGGYPITTPTKFQKIPLLEGRKFGYERKIIVDFGENETLINGVVEVKEGLPFIHKRISDRTLSVKVKDGKRDAFSRNMEGREIFLTIDVLRELLLPPERPRKFGTEAMGAFAGKTLIGVIYEGRFFRITLSNSELFGTIKNDIGVFFGSNWCCSLEKGVVKEAFGTPVNVEDGKIYVHKPTYKAVSVKLSSFVWWLEVDDCVGLFECDGSELVEDDSDFEAHLVDVEGFVTINGQKLQVNSDNYVVAKDGKLYDDVGVEICAVLDEECGLENCDGADIASDDESVGPDIASDDESVGESEDDFVIV
jgi:hypothetical protein